MPPLPAAKLFQEMERLEALACMPVADSYQLAGNLGRIYRAAATANFSDYDIAAVRTAAPALMYRIFDMRMGLRSRIAEFERRGLMTPNVIQGLRDVFRILRYVTDMLGEIATGNARIGEGQHGPLGFTGSNNNTLVNYAFYNGKDLPFRSGDVVLVRGQAHNSAAIARIGTSDSQFSHTGMVYIDPAGKHWMVESLIEDGALVKPLGDALAHGIVRAVLYRHKDTEMAGRAATLIHDYVQRSRAQGRRPILYDFTMRLDDRRKLFCSKLVRYAFAQASNGQYLLSTYKTQIEMKNRDFLDRIGVATTQTYAPADIDLESQFDLVAEWQDYRETSNIRLQDFTMDKLFEWMDVRGYRFEETTAVRLVSVLGRMSAHFTAGTKEFLSSVFPRVPINMPRKTVAAVAMLHKTAEPIYHELQELELQCIAKTGRPQHGDEIFEHLEEIRRRGAGRVGYLVRF